MKFGFVCKQYLKMAVQNFFLPLIYRLSGNGRVDKNRILFADAHHSELPFSMRCLYEETVKAGMQAELHVSDYGRSSFFESLKNMIFFMRRYAKAGYVVICDNFLPAASCRKNPDTKVVQLWHGCGALKKFGYDTPTDIPSYYKGNVLKNCDYVTVSSEWCAPFFASAMRLPKERIVPTGVSRTDLYYKKEFLEDVRERFYREYPGAKGKKVILWAPTFRGNAGNPSACGEKAVDALKEKLSDSYFLIKSLHPHMRPKDSPPPKLTAEELLAVTDLLITDYSSILFDYLIFRRPLVLFAPDLEEYLKERGFYMDYRSLPGTLVTEEAELFDKVKESFARADLQKMEETFRHYMGACDGHATEKILKLMLSE